MRFAFVFALLVALAAAGNSMAAEKQKAPPGLHKVKDIVLYKDERFHSAFPSIVRRPNGELMVAFRRAPDWRPLGEKAYTHTDPNSYLMMLHSKDEGETWSKEPEIFFAHPFGGSQDPCMVQLRDKTLICPSYGWALTPTNAFSKLKQPIMSHGKFVFLGGYILRSKDGKTWDPPIRPASTPTEYKVDLFGNTLSSFNRGAMCEGKDGRLYWVVATHSQEFPNTTITGLMISEDKGLTWKYSCPVAQDQKVTFNETSIYETPKGDLVAFLRTADFDDHTCIARSTDHGKSFQPWKDAGFQGHPHYALQLPDKRALLIYGYRHSPYGVRARILDPECTDFSGTELVLRNDGGSQDLGYPWATMISKNRVLVVYYFNNDDRTRYIAGTILEFDKQ